ncbi:hypothetical protein GWK47_017058 [Chionoecetes opilio]|uniref:Uncharacterized protein n=1 Tax=Chionoecetes opilio TaxID=41210 RepID=A0A8J4XRF8_CHIOP|nr:hypothetical protein GWK47_017058 [Chionoecetes opilio]
MEEKKKIAEETKKEKDLDRIRSTRLRISSSLLAPLTHLQRLCSRAHPPQHRHLLPFPPCGRVGSKPCVPEGGVHSEEPQRPQRRGRAWVGDDFIVQHSLTKDEKTKQDLLQVVEAHRRNYPHPH